MNTPPIDSDRVVMLDRERHMRLDFYALALAEEKTGRNMLTGEGWGFQARDREGNPTGEPAKRLNATEISTLIWACLVHEDPELTVEDVRKMLSLGKRSRDAQIALWELYAEQYEPLDESKTRPTESDGAKDGPSPASTSVLAKSSSGS